MMPLSFAVRGPTPIVAGYQGPGDIVPGAAAWWGLRAYSNASIGGNAIDIRRDSDATIQTFATISGGGLDMAAIATFLTATTGKVTKLYDQTGNGHDFGPLADVTSRPDYNAAAIGSLPGAVFDGSNDTLLKTSAVTVNPQPFTFSMVWMSDSTGTTGRVIFNVKAADITVQRSNANAVTMTAGVDLQQTSVTDDAPHSGKFLFNGALSSIDADPGGGTGGNAGAGVQTTGDIYLGSYDSASFFWKGTFFELGIWPIGFNGTQNTNMHSNHRSYWGF